MNWFHEKIDSQLKFFLKKMLVKSLLNNLLLQYNTIFIWIM